MNRHSIRAALVALTLIGGGLAGAPLLGGATAAEVIVGDIVIAGAFSRATLPNAPVGGGFLTLTNKGMTDDRLIAAASPVAGVMQLHEMKMEGDVMKMAELANGIPVPAGETVTLAPGGLHLMFMQLKEPLVEGTQVPVTLTFERAGTVEVLLDVQAFGAKAPDHSMHGDASGHDAHAAHAHGNGAGMDMSGMSDLDAIAAMQKAMFDKPENPLTMGPIVIVGDYAVSAWAQDGTGGRALLRKAASGWAIHLCSGAGLKDAMELARIGVPHDVAHELAAQLSTADASVAPELVKQFDAFDGVMMIDDSLI